MQSGSSESRVSVTGATSEVTFQVVVNTNYGEEVFVSGSHPALGSWVPTRAIKLSTTRDLYPQWVAKVRLPLDDVGTRTTLYKYLIKASGEHYNWVSCQRGLWFGLLSCSVLVFLFGPFFCLLVWSWLVSYS